MNPYHNTYDRLRAEREAEAGYTALPPTLQTRMGQGLQGYLGGLRSMQPTDNPYGKPHSISFCRVPRIWLVRWHAAIPMQ